jgi:hypothetical protein
MTHWQANLMLMNRMTTRRIIVHLLYLRTSTPRRELPFSARQAPSLSRSMKRQPKVLPLVRVRVP